MGIGSSPARGPSWAIRKSRSAPAVELYRLLPEKRCSAEGYDEVCAETCVLAEGGKALECKIGPADLEALARIRASGYVCTRSRCLPARVFRQDGRRLDLTIFDTRAPGRSANTAKLEKVPASQPIPSLVPPVFYDWLTGGNCCSDCWATHRGWGLTCYADYACCAGTCGVQPGCGDEGGDGGDTENDGDTEGGEGDTCGSSYPVTSATVEYNGRQCSFDGEVHRVIVDGECASVAGDGVIYGCGGAVDSVFVPDPAERETSDVGPVMGRGIG